ncbi:hypothetical protein FQN54_005145 [Arachnomyces sp. PD_36]|nr:hypothetical protein FQN54_005145 [Arachnomyces sp. PD_36]
MRFLSATRAASIAFYATSAFAELNLVETDTDITLSNDRLTTKFDKSAGYIVEIYLDEQDLLGEVDGSSGVGPYLDCHCVPEGFFTPGNTQATLETVSGTDANGTSYGGVIMSDVYPDTGQEFQQYVFMRDGETGLHMFSRHAYFEEDPSFVGELGEFRTLFRPNTDLWTHLSTNLEQTAPLPGDVLDGAEEIQDATWRLSNAPDSAYVQEFSEYFTKYTFSTPWRNAKAHGLYADGSTSDGNAFGAWLVMNTKDTYFGGPIHSDLTVDGIVYNYMISNHHGEGVPNITTGFDRTFGPAFYYFNGGDGEATLEELRADAESYADPSWNADFYDSIAEHVHGYTPSSGRGVVEGHVVLPDDAENPIAVLTVDGEYFQDNSVDWTSAQYWAELDESGSFSIDRVKEGAYRLTVYADGVFGDFFKDGIDVEAGETASVNATWVAESAGVEVWRLGTPDKSSGEFRHGNTKDETHPLGPREHLIYWGAYDWQADFPDGINYTIGESDPAIDFNTVQWSVFGPTPDNDEVETETTHDWVINFTLSPEQLQNATTATFTIQLAGAKTATGNTDEWRPEAEWNNVPLQTYINGDSTDPLEMVIGFQQSSSCIVRSEVSCYQVGSKLTFPADRLNEGLNSFTLHLPADATDPEDAVLPETVYIQYDALRLELE